jgi:D5 N terminal like
MSDTPNLDDFFAAHPELKATAGSNGEPIVITDLANARRLAGTYGDELLYSRQLGDWFVWDGQRFCKDQTGEVARLAKSVVSDMLATVVGEETDETARKEKFKDWLRAQRASAIHGLLDLAWSEAGIAVTVDELDADGMLLNVENGTLDLASLKLRDHDPVDRITKLVAAPYDPTLTRPSSRSSCGTSSPTPKCAASCNALSVGRSPPTSATNASTFRTAPAPTASPRCSAWCAGSSRATAYTFTPTCCSLPSTPSTPPRSLTCSAPGSP